MSQTGKHSIGMKVFQDCINGGLSLLDLIAGKQSVHGFMKQSRSADDQSHQLTTSSVGDRMNPIHHSRIDIWCQKPNFKDHWVTMEHCDQTRCELRGTCGEYRRLNKAVYGFGKGKPKPSPDVDDAVEKALQEMEDNDQLSAAAEGRIAVAYRTQGASGGRNQTRIEIRRQQNRMATIAKSGVHRTTAPARQPLPPIIPRRPKVKAEKRPSHAPKGRGKQIDTGRC